MADNGAPAGGIGRKIKQMNHGDLASSGFWLSQVFMVAATIIGVYLAAQAGLEQAIRFDEISDRENRYYLQRSLHQELTENVALVRAYVTEVLEKGRSVEQIKRQRPNVDQFVWETMRFSSVTLETPTYFLLETKRFYANTEDILDKVSTWSYGAGYAAKLLTEQADRMDNEVLPRLKANYEALAVELRSLGVTVNDYRGAQ